MAEKILVGEMVYNNKSKLLGEVEEIRENGDVLVLVTQDSRQIWDPADVACLKAGKFYVGFQRSHSGGANVLRSIAEAREEAEKLRSALLEEHDTEGIDGAFIIEGVDQYCVTASFDDEPDANHTEWFLTYDEASSYAGSLGEGNIAIGKRLPELLAEVLREAGSEVCFIFDDGTESVWEGDEIDEFYADLPLAVYV